MMRGFGNSRLRRLAAGVLNCASPRIHLPQRQYTSLASSRIPADGKSLADFVGTTGTACTPQEVHQVSAADVFPVVGTVQRAQPQRRLVFMQTMGCQMNVSDSEVVLSILQAAGYDQTQDVQHADVVLINTCAIREGAERRIWSWLGNIRHQLYGHNSSSASHWRHRRAGEPRPVVGVLGCMAERLKEQVLESEKVVDLVAGPDAYRDLPRLIAAVQGPDANVSSSSVSSGRSTAMNVQLSLEETYADVVPLRSAGATSAFLSIMRGCNNMCAFCIVPFTRGRERSRPADSIIAEVRMLSKQGVKEVTLLGQNVNSYADWSTSANAPADARRPSKNSANVYAEGFASVYKPRREGATTFAQLLARVAAVDPEMRVRFTSPHPKDFSDSVLEVIRDNHNVCSQLHMPVQSGSSSMLARMKRGYTRAAYDALVAHVRHMIPGIALSTDIIAGFCGETAEEHAATVDLMKTVRFDTAFMFAYSQRAKTAAARHQQDDVPEAVKNGRLQEIIATFREGLAESMAAEVGRMHLVLVEGPSRRDPTWLTGRTDTMKRVIFPDVAMPTTYSTLASALSENTSHISPPTSADSHKNAEIRWSRTTSQSDQHTPVGSDAYDCKSKESKGSSSSSSSRAEPGNYVAVEVVSASPGTLTARPVALTTLRQFVAVHGCCNPPADGHAYHLSSLRPGPTNATSDHMQPEMPPEQRHETAAEAVA